MKKSALVLIFCLCATCACYAQQNTVDAPASAADVQRFLDAMHTRDMMAKMMSAIKIQQHQMIHEQIEKQKNLPPDFEAKMDDMIDQTFDNMPIDDLLQVTIPVYQKHFTKGDMDALVAFYTSPTGQKMVKELPEITAESMQASSGIIQKMMAQTTQRIQEQIAQAQKQSAGSTKDK